MQNALGVLQGRLTPPKGRGVQFYPANPTEWEREFELARELGIAHIQWACDTEHNPVFNKDFRKKVKAVVAESGIPVKNIDAQLLVKLDIALCPQILIENLCEAVADLGAGTLEIPLLEGSSLLDTAMRDVRLAALEDAVETGKKFGVRIAIETDPPPLELAAILTTHPDVTVVYDSGNSAGFGYDVEAEWNAYGKKVSNVHIKDRVLGGSTVALGTGAADFPRLFKSLASIRYRGPITLQAARGKDGSEAETVRNQLAFVRKYMANALL